MYFLAFIFCFVQPSRHVQSHCLVSPGKVLASESFYKLKAAGTYRWMHHREEGLKFVHQVDRKL